MAADSRYFQWLVGERRGEVLVFDTIVEEDGDVFIVFKDNSRMNQNFIAQLNQTDVTGKMMAEVENMSKLWRFEEKIVGEETNRTEVDWESQVRYEVPSVTEIASGGQKLPVQKKQITLIPPARTRPEVVESKFGKVIIQKVTETPVIVDNGSIGINNSGPSTSLKMASVNHNDPVYIMLDKSKKVDTEVEMTLTISLPSESLYNVAKESFDDGAKKALEYIIENIDISKIKEALKAGIKARYEKPDYIEPDYNTDNALINAMYSIPEPGSVNNELKLDNSNG